MAGYKKLSEYGVIGNTHTTALISNEASIDFLCMPRFDSPSTFASILDSKKGGKFQIRPTEIYKSQSKYEENTNILVTTFKTAGGEIRITDFMPVHLDEGDKFHVSDELHRIVECTKGKAEIEIIFAPKFNYARNNTKVSKTNFGFLATDGTVKIGISTKVTDRRFVVSKGEKIIFVLSWNSRPKQTSSLVTYKRLRETRGYWRGVVNKINYSGQWRDEVTRSFLILHLLFYSPTGTIVAAATTSIPEKIGGPRNWDYRFSWVRDASFTLQALFAVGDYTEALEYFSWLSTVCEKCGIDLKVLFGVSVESKLDEEELTHFEGYRGSKPVRIGNAAEEQLQLDIFGEILDAAYIFHQKGGQITPTIWQLIESLVEAVHRNWEKKDKSIWEVRSEPQHFVISKVFSWVAIDRGIKIAQSLNYASEKIERWERTKEEIKADVMSKGYNDKVGSFTQHYDTEALDAASLLMPLVGFIPIDDPKMLSTIDAITNKLEENNFLHRYIPEEAPDGVGGDEGTFLAVNFWLVQDLILLNRLDDAKKMYERLLKTGSPLGIFSEMFDPKTGEMLGNLPQALTHIEVILTAYYLDGLEDVKGG